MGQESIVRLIAEDGPNGVMYISSPDIPLLHILLKPGESPEEIILPLVKEMIERKHRYSVNLRMVNLLDDVGGEQNKPCRLPAHIIAQVAA